MIRITHGTPTDYPTTTPITSIAPTTPQAARNALHRFEAGRVVLEPLQPSEQLLTVTTRQPSDPHGRSSILRVDRHGAEMLRRAKREGSSIATAIKLDYCLQPVQLAKTA